MVSNSAYILNMYTNIIYTIPFENGNGLCFDRRPNIGKDLKMYALRDGVKYIQQAPISGLIVRNIGTNIERRSIEVFNIVTNVSTVYPFSFSSYLCFLYNIEDPKERMYLFKDENEIAVYEDLTNIKVIFIIS